MRIIKLGEMRQTLRGRLKKESVHILNETNLNHNCTFLCSNIFMVKVNVAMESVRYLSYFYKLALNQLVWISIILIQYANNGFSMNKAIEKKTSLCTKMEIFWKVQHICPRRRGG